MAEIEPIEGASGEAGQAGPVPTEIVASTPPPVVPTGLPGATPARPRGLARWGVALVVLALVVGAVSAGAVFLTAGSTATSKVAGWLPKDTLVYAELRADFPGDQKANLGSFLSTFPGFKDQAALDAKMDQALDRLLDKSDVSWSRDIKPWLAGEVGLAVTSAALGSLDAATLGGLAGGASADPAAPNDGMVVIVATTDAAKAEAWLAARPMLSGTKATADYAGTTLTTVTTGTGTIAYATRDTLLFFGLEGAVKGALDTNGKSTISDSSSFRDARKTATGDYVGYFYLDVAPILEKSLAASAGAGSTPSPCTAGLFAGAPAWLAGVARMEPDALAVSASAPQGTGATATKDAPSELAKHLPASTIAVAGQREGGKALVTLYAELKKQLACIPGSEGSAAQIDQALGLLGGIDGLVGWAGDTGLAVTLDGTAWGGGLVAVADDQAAAGRLAEQLGSFLALAGSQPGSGVTIGSETYGDGKISTLEIPLGTGTTTLPFDNVVLGLTYQRGVFVLGTLDFVKAVVDTKAGASLASASRYTAAIDRAGGSGVSELWLDAAALRAGIEALLPADAKAPYLANVQPYLAPFDIVVMVGHGGDPQTVRMLITVK